MRITSNTQTPIMQQVKGQEPSTKSDSPSSSKTESTTLSKTDSTTLSKTDMSAASKLEGSALTKTLVGLEKGSILIGVLKDVLPQSVSVEVKGKGTVNVELPELKGQLKGQALALASPIAIEITETDPKLRGKLVQTGQPSPLEEPERQLLQQLKLPETERNLKAAAMITAYKLEPTSAMIKGLVDGSISASMLSGMSQDQLDAIEPQMTLKEAVILLMKKEGTNPGSASVPSTTTASPTGNGIGPGSGNINPSPATPSPEAMNKALIPNLTTDLGANPIAEGEPEEGQLGPQIKQALPGQDGSKSLVIRLSETFAAFDLEKAAVLQKAGMPLTVKNAVESEKILFGTHTLSKQVKHLSALVQQNDWPALSEAKFNQLKALVEQENLNVDSQLKMATDLLEVLKDQPGAEGLKQGLEEFKSSLEFVKELNQTVNFVQLPIQVNDEVRNVDLFMKKKPGGSKNPDEMKLLIALETETTGNVQAFLDWNKDRLKVTFRLPSEGVEALYADDLPALQASLKEALDKPVFIETLSKEETFPIMSFFKEEEEETGYSFSAKV